MKINKKVVIFPAVALALLFTFYLIRGCSSKKNDIYEYEKVSTGAVKRTIAVTGVLQVIDTYYVTAKIEGIVTRIYADFNTNVKAGQLLATIDSSSYEHSLNKLSTSIETSKLKLNSALNDLESKKKMLDENLISQKAYELAEIVYKTAYYEHKNIQNEYNNTRDLRNSTRLVSPINGLVLDRKIEANQAVKPGLQVFEIVPSLKQMRLIINVDESDIGSVKAGQEVFFTVSAFSDKTFNGKINQVRINPISSGSLVTYQSVVHCDNDELLLKPGMTATATVIINEKKDVLRISNQAFLVSPDGKYRETGKKYLWLRQNSSDKVDKIEVQTGISGDNFTEILSGIKKDDSVLVKIVKKQ
jgi:HlyD family secretion protein